MDRPNMSKLCRLLLVCFGLVWILDSSIAEKDFNTCSFYYWKVDWHSAVQTCQRDNKQLLCYKSKQEVEDITEAFRLSAYGNAELELWLSSKNCSETDKMEECLSLHIKKSAQNVWHYFQEECEEHFPFVCCVKESDRPTTELTTQSSTTNKVKTSSTHELSSSSTSTPVLTSSIRPDVCRKVEKRGISWPDTSRGEVAIQPCPGKSTGKARWCCGKEGIGKWDEHGPDLRKCRAYDVINLKEKFNTSSLDDAMSLLEEVFRDTKKEIFGQDLDDVISLMTSLPDRLFTATRSQSRSVRWTVTKDLVGRSTSVFDRMIELNTTWQDLAEVSVLTNLSIFYIYRCCEVCLSVQLQKSTVFNLYAPNRA